MRFLIIKEGVHPVVTMLEMIDMLYKEKIACNDVVFICFRATNRGELVKHPPNTVHELTYVLYTLSKPDNEEVAGPILKRIKDCVRKKKSLIEFLEALYDTTKRRKR